MRQVPEVTTWAGAAAVPSWMSMPRACVSELDVGLKPASELRAHGRGQADIRARVWRPAGAVRWASRSRTASTTCSRACARRSPSSCLARILDTPARPGREPAARLSGGGPADLEVEKQVLAPQITVRVGLRRRGAVRRERRPGAGHAAKPGRGREARRRSSRAGAALRWWSSCPTGAFARGLSQLLSRPQGRIPLSRLASIEDATARTRSAATTASGASCCRPTPQGRPLSEIVADIRKVVAGAKLPEGYFITLGGQFQAQEEASRLVGLLSVVSLALMFVVLYSRYQSARCRRSSW